MNCLSVMESEPTSTEETDMSQSGPRNFYCHQCNSRTRISIEVSKIRLYNNQHCEKFCLSSVILTTLFQFQGIHMFNMWLWIYRRNC